ncbi:MAG: hypothetical protein OEW19_06425 [Acidobacteriota bacterium]|nr:hypothetical protein [Acidobacteriota bacterium]
MDVLPQPPSPWEIDPTAFPREGSEADRLRFLLRYALLAPSTRNTQPWQFRVSHTEVELHLDMARWQRVADADQREMYISVGCALENLLVAAAHYGYRTAADGIASNRHPTLVARVRFMPHDVPPPSVGDPRFEAMRRRRTEHGVYDGTPVAAEDLTALSEVSLEPGQRLDWITDDAGRHAVDELVMRADALLLSRPDYRHELGELIGTGAFGAPWLIATVGRFAVSYLMPAASFAKADHKAITSSPVLGVISAHTGTREAQVRAGQLLERLYLEGTVRGLSLQPVSQLLQTDETREALTALLPDPAWVPLQPLRLGHAKPHDSHTPRRALDEVLLP